MTWSLDVLKREVREHTGMLKLWFSAHKYNEVPKTCPVEILATEYSCLTLLLPQKLWANEQPTRIKLTVSSKARVQRRYWPCPASHTPYSCPFLWGVIFMWAPGNNRFKRANVTFLRLSVTCTPAATVSLGFNYAQTFRESTQHHAFS